MAVLCLDLGGTNTGYVLRDEKTRESYGQIQKKETSSFKDDDGIINLIMCIFVIKTNKELCRIFLQKP